MDFSFAHCSTIDLNNFLSLCLQYHNSFVSQWVHRCTFAVGGIYVNYYAVTLGIAIYTTFDKQDCFLDYIDIDYSSDELCEHWDSDRDQEHLL